jgi:hypothetical protein
LEVDGIWLPTPPAGFDRQASLQPSSDLTSDFESPIGPPAIGALLRAPLETIRARMLAGLRDAGFTDLGLTCEDDSAAAANRGSARGRRGRRWVAPDELGVAFPRS